VYFASNATGDTRTLSSVSGSGKELTWDWRTCSNVVASKFAGRVATWAAV
jgi:hypothetical protein